jgi:hypothetical protein
MFSICSRQYLITTLIPIVYKQIHTQYGPHDLALMLIVLGIGALVDLNSEPYNLEAQHYYRLSRATLSLQSVLSEHSIVTVKVIATLSIQDLVDLRSSKTLHLMSIYNGMSGNEANLERSYALLSLSAQVALKVRIRRTILLG